jgi:sugar phosphate isomerase/epimerase
MKLSVMSYTLARQLSPDQLDLVRMFEFTRELGLEAVDIVTTYGRHPREVRRLLDDFGLRAACHTFNADFNQTDAAVLQEALDTVRRGLENAVVLGAPSIMVVTPGKEGVAREETRRRYIEGFARAVPFAREAGVNLTVENFPGALSPFVTAADFLEAKRKVPDLRLTFDSGNVFTGGEDPAASFRLCAGDVVHAHFKDWTHPEPSAGMLGLDGRRYTPALIGEGLLDHRGCLAAMREAGYGGYINIEYEGDAYNAEDATRRAVTYLTGLLDEEIV